METEPAGKEFPAPVFIIGCMRSGTTFLVDTLCRHPQLLRIGNELRSVWTELGNAPCEGADCAYREAEDVSSEVVANMTHYFHDYIRESKNIRRHLMRFKNKWNTGGGSVFYDWEHIRPVNKSTHLVNKIDYLQAMFPHAQFIFIIRSIEGQCGSLKMHVLRDHERNQRYLYAPKSPKSSWSQLLQSEFPAHFTQDRAFPEQFDLLPEMWIRLNYLAMQAFSQMDKSRYHIIRYEDLVMNQAAEFESMFSFLKLEEKYQAKVKQIASSKLKVINTTTKGNPMEKWKKHLTEEEIKMIADKKKEFQVEYEFIEGMI